MSIPVHARVRAVPNFLACLRAAQAFMTEQDERSAPARFQRLQADVIKARDLLAFAPQSGRPTRFLDARTGWGRFQAQQALQLARQLGMPELREVVLSRHVVLYAHSEQSVALLTLRSERQIGYQLKSSG